MILDRVSQLFERYGVIVAFVGLLVWNGVFAENADVFRSPENLRNILNQNAATGIVAIGMTLVIATRGVDLSVGAVVAIASAIVATLVSQKGVAWPIAMAGALGAALLAGLWNGSLVTFLRLQPIVATLVLMVAGRGIAQLITDGQIVTVRDPAVAFLGNASLLLLPATVSALAVISALAWLGTRRTAFGLFLEAVGENERAARLSGIPVRPVLLVAYAACGLCAGVAGLIDCAYIRAADANNAGQLLELDAILAVVLGGTALTGGRFSLLGSVIGAMLMQTLTKVLYVFDVSADIAPAPKAAIVLAVCLLQSPTFRAACSRHLESARARLRPGTEARP